MARDYARGRGRERQAWADWYRDGAALRARAARSAALEAPEPVRVAQASARAALVNLAGQLAKESGLDRAAAVQVLARAARQLAVDCLADWGTSAQESGSRAAQGELSGLDARGGSGRDLEPGGQG